MAWRARLGILAVIAATAVVLPLLHPIDAPVMRWLATWRTPALVTLAKQVSTLGELHLIPLAIVLALWGWTETKRKVGGRLALGAATLAMLVGGILVQLLKQVFGRPRPHLPIPDQIDWFHPGWNSFPSGHATHWFALLGALWVFSPRLSLWSTPLMLIVLFARVLVPRHYPTDLLGGAILGLLCGFCLGRAAQILNARLDRPTTLDS